jgi:hypothetical protein
MTDKLLLALSVTYIIEGTNSVAELDTEVWVVEAEPVTVDEEVTLVVSADE